MYIFKSTRKSCEVEGQTHNPNRSPDSQKTLRVRDYAHSIEPLDVENGITESVEMNGLHRSTEKQTANIRITKSELSLSISCESQTKNSKFMAGSNSLISNQ